MLSAAPAPAQVYGQVSEPLAVEAMVNFGQCVARFTPQGARRVLAMDYRTEAYATAMRKLARGHGRCAPRSEIRFNGVLFAGAMAEALLETEGTPASLPSRLAPNPARSPIAARSPVETMALCTVLAAPTATAGLFATTPASAEEAAAMQALEPTLAACLANGRKLELNRPGLRAVLALAAWRIASAPLVAGENG